MAEIYTQQLAMAKTEAGGEANLYTAGPTGRTVLRDVCIGNDNAAAQSVLLILRSPEHPGSHFLFGSATYQAGELQHHEGRQVVPPGATISIYGSSGSVSVLLTGYQLGS